MERRDFDMLSRWAILVRNPLGILLSLTYGDDELRRWRAIEAIGKVAGWLTIRGIEKVRDFIRRLLWLMNDESGGLGWFCPEIIGEILVNVPALAREYAGLLPAYFHQEPFEKGTHQAVYRVAQVCPLPFVKSIPKLADSLNNPDPVV
ncbi:MAG: hypothetical protein JSV44_02190, partial [Candidatus Zixiibacteriota bacterium]